jgi:hypothetical protein
VGQSSGQACHHKQGVMVIPARVPASVWAFCDVCIDL